MKIRSCLICLLVALVIAAVSCTDRGGRVRSALAAADSLMMTAPEAALDTLYGIDSTSIRKLDRGGRALYTLLRTEAEYKCYLPVAEDTAVFEAADYYRRKGPEELLARALIMEGAVLSEQGDAEGAMLSYKEAEPILGRSGDLEQLGLLNTRIGELYQVNVVNNNAALERYTKALKCFKQTGLHEREMYTRLALARLLLPDSIDAARYQIRNLLTLSERYGDNDVKLYTYELLAYLYYYEEDYHRLIRVADMLSKDFSDCINDSHYFHIFDNIFAFEAVSYARLGFADSARNALRKIQKADDDIIKMQYYWIEEEIAKSENNWADAYSYSEKANIIADSIAESGYRNQLYLKEQSIDKERLINENLSYKLRQNKIVKYSLFSVIVLFALLSVVYIRYRQLCLKYDRLSISILKGDRKNVTSVDPETEQLLLDFMELSKRIHEIRYRYEKMGTAYMREVDTVLKQYFPAQDTDRKIRNICNHLYPDVLDRIGKEYPSLTANDIQLIALMACGFPTGAICAIKRVGENSLNVQKSRTAKKIGTGIRLKDFVADNFKVS